MSAYVIHHRRMSSKLRRRKPFCAASSDASTSHRRFPSIQKETFRTRSLNTRYTFFRNIQIKNASIDFESFQAQHERNFSKHWCNPYHGKGYQVRRRRQSCHVERCRHTCRCCTGKIFEDFAEDSARPYGVCDTVHKQGILFRESFFHRLLSSLPSSPLYQLTSETVHRLGHPWAQRP